MLKSPRVANHTSTLICTKLSHEFLRINTLPPIKGFSIPPLVIIQSKTQVLVFDVLMCYIQQVLNQVVQVIRVSLHSDTASCVMMPCFCLCFAEVTIKQEEDTAEEDDNRSPALEEIGQTGEEADTLEESMTDSPSNIQDGLSGSNMTADSGNRPNGTDGNIHTGLLKCFKPSSKTISET